MELTLNRSRSAAPALTLFGFLAVTFAAAAIGGAVTSSSVSSWYQFLAKPAYSPPDWVFAPVWSALYAFMAIAAWRVYGTLRRGIDSAEMWAYGVQLTLNVLWTVVFFGLRLPGEAFVVMMVLWVSILATTVAFYERDRKAGLLMVPYLAWVSFAACLNMAIWRLN